MEEEWGKGGCLRAGSHWLTVVGVDAVGVDAGGVGVIAGADKGAKGPVLRLAGREGKGRGDGEGEEGGEDEDGGG